MKVLSIGSIESDDIDYHLSLEQPYSQPPRRLQIQDRGKSGPIASRSILQALVLNLRIEVIGTGKTESEIVTLREDVLAELDTSDAAVPLVVSDNDDSRPRYRYVVVQKIDEQPSSEGLGQEFVATLVTHDIQPWRSTTPTTYSWPVTESGETLAVTNSGSLSVRPTFSFRPTSERVGSDNRWSWRQHWAVPWTSPFERRNYPVNVTNGFWDSEALVDGGEIYGAYGENNIAVIVDGQEVRRWIAGYDTPTTGVWVNLDFAPAATTRLLTSIGSGDTVTEVAANWGIEGFPHRGMLLIDEEVFTYEAKDDARQRFLNVRRAQKDTLADNHSGGSPGAGAVIYWLQHEIWLVYGGAGYHQLADYGGRPYDAYKPVMNLADSFNDYWQFDEFGQSGTEYANRAAAWSPRETPGHWALSGGDPWENVSVSRAVNAAMGGFPDETGQPDLSYWTLRAAAYPVGQVNAVGASLASEEGGWDVRVDVAAGSQYALAIPQPEALNAFEAFDVTADLATGFHVEEVRFIQQSGAGMQSVLYTLSMVFTEAPIVYPSVAVEVYSMDTQLENVTTGESITLRTELLLADEIEVDTEQRTVTRASDGENVYYALERDRRRLEMLVLQPGVNTLRLTESGLTGMTVVIEFEARTYS